MSNTAFNPLYLTLALLAICCVVSMYVARKFQREVAEDSTPATPNELYGPLEKAYYAGLMREDEYLRIREKMARENPPAKAKAKATAAKGKPEDEDWNALDPSAG